MPSGRTNSYPESGRGLGQVTPTIFGIRSNISLKLLELETSNLMYGFVWAMPSRRINNYPESRRGLGQVTITIFGSTVGYPSDSLASCCYPDNFIERDCVLINARLSHKPLKYTLLCVYTIRYDTIR